MLTFLQGKVSDRKLRLFACAYARTGSWLQEFSNLCFAHFYEGWGRRKPAIDTDAAQAALLALRQAPTQGPNSLSFRGQPPRGVEGAKLVALAEMYAEGLCNIQQIDNARRELEPKLNDARTGAAYCGPSAFRPVEEYAMLLATLAPSGQAAAEGAVASVAHYFVAVADGGPRRGLNSGFHAPLRQQTLLLQADLLRELFGNPFRTPSIEADWRTSSVLGIARSVEEDQGFDRLPILADALEEAGCTSADLLAHCRSEGDHVRGCWALDRVLANV
jgi:hypothetical protein